MTVQLSLLRTTFILKLKTATMAVYALVRSSPTNFISEPKSMMRLAVTVNLCGPTGPKTQTVSSDYPSIPLFSHPVTRAKMNFGRIEDPVTTGGQYVHLYVNFVQSKLPALLIRQAPTDAILELSKNLLRRIGISLHNLQCPRFVLAFKVHSVRGIIADSQLPLSSDQTVENLLSMVPDHDNNGNIVLHASVFSEVIDIFDVDDCTKIDWTLPLDLQDDVARRNDNIDCIIIHQVTLYKITKTMPIMSTGANVKDLIRQNCFIACTDDLVGQDPSLPSLVDDDQIELYVQIPVPH